MILNGFITFTLMLLLPLLSVAAPSSLTYQGRILKQDGSPLEYSNVAFVFQITNPSGSCVLYQEQVSGINMVNSGGVFDVQIGKGTLQYLSSGSTILDAFNNNSSFTCGACTTNGSTYSCSTGSSTFTPHADDGRLLRVAFWDGVGWRTINTDNEIRSVPYAAYSLSAQKLGNNVADDFLLKGPIPTCPPDTFLTWNGSAMSCVPVSGAAGGTVTNVTSTNSYLVVANGTSAPALTLNVGTGANSVAAGNDSRIVNAMQTGAAAGGDLSGNYPNPKVAGLQGIAVSTSVPGSGQFLKYNGTNWSGAALSSTDISDLATNYLTQASFNNAISAASCSVSQTMYWNSVAGKFQCQNINVGLAGDVTGSIGAAKVVALQNRSVSSTAPTANQVLQWDGSAWTPTDLPAANLGNATGVLAVSKGGTGQSTYTDGQILIGNSVGNTLTKSTLTAGSGINITNGNGAITISAVASGTVTSVSGTSPVNVTGTTTPVVSLANGSAAGQVYRWNGTANWVATKLTYTDLINASSGSPWPTVTCTSGQAVTWSSASDSFTCTTLSIATSQLTGTLAAAQMPAFSGDVSSAAGSTTLTLANSGATAGTYKSVTVDAKGRVTSGTNPTNLSGYGITDAIQNIGGTPGMQTGADSSKPASPAAGTIYFANDTNKIYQYNSGAWATIASASGSGGTITALTSDVTASGSGSVAATVNSVGGSTAANVHTAELVANAATSANTASTIVKRDASGNFTAGTITGSLTGAASLNVLKAGDTMTGHLTYAANIGDIYTAGTGGNTVALRGPTAAIGTSYVLRLPTAQGTANQFMTNDGSGNLSWTSLSSLGVASVAVTSPITNSGTATAPNISIQQANTSQAGYLSNTDWNTFNNKLSTTLSSANIFVGNGSNVATGVPASGDVTLTNGGAFTVTKLQGSTVSATAPVTAGQVMRWSGSAWTPNFVSMFDLRSTITGTQAFGGVGCTAGQTLTWTAATDNLACTTIAISGTQVTYASQSANTFFAAPSGGSGAPSFRTIASADLPANLIVNGGNSLGSAVTVGTNDGNDLNLETSGSTRLTVTSAGNVGIGTSSPSQLLHVNSAGDAQMYLTSTGGSNFAQYTAASTGVTTTLFAQPGAGGVGTNSNYPFYIRTNNVERMRIDTAGNVGIGTASPTAKLHINGTFTNLDPANLATYDYVAQIGVTNNAGGTNWSRIGFGQVTTNNMFIEAADQSNTKGNLNLQPYGGNVGIGTTAPITKFHIGGDSDMTIDGSTPFVITRSTTYPSGGAEVGGIAYTSESSAASTNIWPPQASLAFVPSQAHTASAKGTGMYFSTTPNGSTGRLTRMVIGENGYVGLGTTSPSYPLQLVTNDQDYSLNIDNYSNTVGARATAIRLGRALGTSAGPAGITAGTVIGGMYFSGYHSGGGWSGNNGAVRAIASEAFTATAQGTELSFRTTPTGTTGTRESLVIKSDGAVGIGTTTPTSTLTVQSLNNINNGSNLTNGIAAVRISDGSSISMLIDTNQIEQMDPSNFLYLNYNSAANTIINQGGGKVAIGNVASLTYLLQLGTDSAAKPGTSTWTIASDIRLKDVRAPFVRGLDALEGIHPIYFNYKKDNALGLPSDKEFVGIKAQDALAVVPEAVSQDEQGFYHVTNDAIIWTMMNAVKELYHRWMDDSQNVHRSVASLQEENASLKQKDQEKDAKIKELEQRLEKLERALDGR